MKKLCLLTVVLGYAAGLAAQKIISTETFTNTGSYKRMVAQAGKGVWLVSDESLTLFNPATGKFIVSNMTDDNKLLPPVVYLSVYKDKAVCVGRGGVFMLQSNGKWKNITPTSMKNGNAVFAVSLSADELTLIDGNAIYRYRNNNWLNSFGPYKTAYSGGSPAANSFIFADGRKYYYGLSNGIYVYDTVSKTSQQFAYGSTYETVVQPGQGFWIRNGATLNFVPEGNSNAAPKISLNNSELFSSAGKTASSFSAGKSIANCRLIANEKNEVFLAGIDTAVKLSVSASLTNDYKIEPQKTSIPKTTLASSFKYALYNNIFYRSGNDGFAKLNNNKPEILQGLKYKSDSKEGYNLLLPDGRLLTKDRNAIWISNNKDLVKKIEPDGSYVLDMATDGKKFYVLTSGKIYRESAAGKLDSIGLNDTEMNSIAVDKTGKIWMASHKGITTLQNGKKEFIPAKEIEGFPPNQATHNISIGPDGNCYISLSNVYLCKDKKMTLLAGSPGLVYEHHFDGKGNIYFAGIGSYHVYDGSQTTELKKKMTEKYPDEKFPYVHGIAVDNKGRVWAISAFADKKGLMVFENGNITRFFTEEVKINDPFNCKIFSRNNELLITDSKSGWTVVKIGD